jgi:hypothetical protein
MITGKSVICCTEKKIEQYTHYTLQNDIFKIILRYFLFCTIDTVLRQGIVDLKVNKNK